MAKVWIVAETDGYDAWSNEAVFDNLNAAENMAILKPRPENGRGDYYVIQEFELKSEGNQ